MRLVVDEWISRPLVPTTHQAAAVSTGCNHQQAQRGAKHPGGHRSRTGSASGGAGYVKKRHPGREFPERSFLSLLSLQPCVFRDLRAPYAGLLPCASLGIRSPFCSGKGIRSDRSGHSAVPWQRPLAAPPSPAAEATVVLQSGKASSLQTLLASAPSERLPGRVAADTSGRLHQTTRARDTELQPPLGVCN